MPRKKTDWIPIEREIRAGQLSNREIARQFEVSETAIRKRIKTRGIERDLSKRVREQVRTKLVRNEVRKDNVSDDQIVDEAAERAVERIEIHRKDIAALRELEAGLISELSGSPTKLYMAQYQGQIVEKEVGLTVAEKAMAANNLANVQHKRIQLERQAYSLGENNDDGKITVEVVEFDCGE